MKRTIYSRFLAVAESMPQALAIIDDERRVTYAELRDMADRIAATFYSKRPVFVGVVMSHGAEQIAAMLAILKSGGAYIPAEPSLPQARIDYMMEAAGAEFMITDEYCRNLPPAPAPITDRSEPDNLAYVLYTSGTSGFPKGVCVENHSVVNYAEAFEAEFHTGPGDVMLQYSVCSFDIFVEEVFTTLLNGAALAIPSPAVHGEKIQGLVRYVERNGVTIIDGFPYLLADMNKLPKIPASVRLIISGGDVIRSSYISHLLGKGVMIYNTYGPSETTVCSNYFRVDNAEPLADGTFPIGRAIKGVQVRILDSGLRPVTKGEVGEICILGEGVSRGYINHAPEQSNFVTLPDGQRMYRSGDLGYELPDGNIAFLHRRDNQVMILGKRVEPDEVENVLNTAPGVERAAVRAFLDESGLYYLVAYFIGSANCRLSAIRDYLASKLTDFMIPEFFVKVQSIPITRRGKVDSAALPRVMKMAVV